MNRSKSFVTMLLLVGGLSAVTAFAQPDPPRPPQPPRIAKRMDAFGSSSFLGVGVVEIDAERAKELKLKEERGVEVKSVEEESPAAKAGVKVGDVVLEYSGQRVEGAEQFVRLVRETPVGRQVKLLISRNGANQTLTPTIGSRPFGQYFSKEVDEAWSKIKTLEMPDFPHPTMSIRSRVLGAETESLSSQLAEFFGVKEGALVRSVIRGSAAEKAGLKAGDVITKIGDRKVSGPSDLISAVRSRSRGSLALTVIRNQKEMVINVTLQEGPSGRGRNAVRMDVKVL
jgi:serine protease Do